MVRQVPAWCVLVVLGCGDPVLKNVPKPNTAAVAGAAAAVAGAATLADPTYAAKHAEQARKADEPKREQPAGPTVPADVLDRLDAQHDAPPPSGPRPGAQPHAAPGPRVEQQGASTR